MKFRHLILASAASLTLVTPAFAQRADPVGAATAAPVADLVRAVDIPYRQFTLPNGLRVVVHTDRKAPIVAVSVWYDVGSTFEPAGQTGFAHLFEHLMFNGSENAPGDFFEPLKQVGATDFNGTTSFDRTNYFETVPRAALDRALFLESDRMGHLTGAITQAVLDEQRGVVQNEKRQGDNQPYGLAQYKLTEGIFPPDHPYGHTTIGSMADLDRASLADVKSWFHDHYGPNNAVLVLAGDIDLAAAEPLVEKYFGTIPRGPESVAPQAPVPVLASSTSEVTKDRVAATLIVKEWAVPGLNDPDAVSLDVAASVLGGLASSRLDNALVREEKLAVQVGASNSDYAQVGTFTIDAVVRPGADPAVVSRRIDEILAKFLETGPTADEVARVVTSSVSRRISGLESIGGFGGKAVALAQGELYSSDPGYYKKQLARLAVQTPAIVKAAADKWLTRKNYTLQVVDGARDVYEKAGVPPRVAVAAAPEPAPKGTRGPLPGVGAISDLAFPQVERAKLSNGVELVYAQRTAVPITQAVVSFDAGTAADVADKLGTQQLMLGLLDEGTTTLGSVQIAEAEERLGAAISASFSDDRTMVSLRAPSANLAPATALFADVIRNPAFAPAEVARVRDQQLALISQELTSPDDLGDRILPKLVFGPASPYAKSQGAGDPKAVALLKRDDLVAFQHAWLRPEKARIFVVSDRSLAEVRDLLERRFGDWKGTGAPGVKRFTDGAYVPTAKIILVDRADSPQSVISGGAPSGLSGNRQLLPLQVANDALGGSFTSRINMNLREAKHWSYGASGAFDRLEHAAPYLVNAPVQADKTGASLAELRREITDYLGPKPMTQVEFDRAVNGAIRSLPGSFETAGDVLAAMQRNDLFARPDDYYQTIAAKYRALTLAEADQAARAAIDPAKFVWVIVGDAKTVRPQLDSIGLPVEIVPAASVVDANQEKTNG